MHMKFTESLLDGAVFARSIKVLGWQPEAPKLREHDFPKKNLLIVLNSSNQRHPYGFCSPPETCIWSPQKLY